MIVPTDTGSGGLLLRTAAGWLFMDPFTRDVRPASAAEANEAIERNPALRARRELISSPGFQSVRAFVGTGPDGRTWPITDVIPTDDPARFWVASAGAGLTLLDLDEDGPIPLTMSHVAARQEVRALVEALKLPAGLLS